MGARSEQIGVFLKAARARLTPADVGLRPPWRGRTPGLRREDVAALAGVGVTWYTLLEQGRDINVSEDVLERISTSLQLSSQEREYLFSLVQGRPAPRHTEENTPVSRSLRRVMKYMPAPALVVTARWDILVWNELISRVFRDYSQYPPQQRNLLKIILTDEKYHRDPDQFDSLARFLLAKFRVDFSQYVGDASFEELIAELSETVPRFRQLWKNAEISSSIQGIRNVHHPELGELSFDQSSYVPEENPYLRLVMFIPRDERTSAVIMKLAGLHTVTAPKPGSGGTPARRRGGSGEQAR